MILKLIHRITKGIIAILTTVVIIAGTAQVVCRYILKSSIPWSEELMRYSFIWIIILGATIAAGEGSLASFAFLERILEKKAIQNNKLWERITFVYKIAGKLISIFFCGLLFWYGTKLVMLQARTGQSTPALEIPIYIVALAIPVGGIIMFYIYLEKTKKLISRKER